MKPISPNEVKQKRIESIPDFVIEAANNLIAKKWNGYSATVKLNDLVKEALKVGGVDDNKISRQDLFENHYLDIEPIFEKAGWKVNFDQPAYNETYDSFYVFKPKNQKNDE